MGPQEKERTSARTSPEGDSDTAPPHTGGFTSFSVSLSEDMGGAAASEVARVE